MTPAAAPALINVMDKETVLALEPFARTYNADIAEMKMALDFVQIHKELLATTTYFATELLMCAMDLEIALAQARHALSVLTVATKHPEHVLAHLVWTAPVPLRILAAQIPVEQNSSVSALNCWLL